MPCNYAEYPPDWKDIRARILLRADYRCEMCGAVNHEWVNRETREPEMEDFPGVRIVLTIAHLDHDHKNWSVKDERLKALCQRCHNRYDAPYRVAHKKQKTEYSDRQQLLIGRIS